MSICPSTPPSLLVSSGKNLVDSGNGGDGMVSPTRAATLWYTIASMITESLSMTLPLLEEEKDIRRGHANHALVCNGFTNGTSGNTQTAADTTFTVETSVSLALRSWART